MDAPVVASIITSSAALVVAVGGGIRAEYSAAVERRYERRRAFLMEAQDAALALRNALRRYGSELERQAAAETDATGTFVLQATEVVDDRVAEARGRLEVAESRVEDGAVRRALDSWVDLARRSLIGREEDAAAEQAAFDEMNRLIGVALRTMRGVGSGSRRRG